jgi:RHS repeat-associated protein
MKEYKISGVSTATYTYNAYNQRTKKVTGGVTTHYVYGAGGLMLGEYTTAGVMNREYVYLNGAPFAQVTAGSPETVAYLHTDHLGTPRYATNAAGTQVWSWNNDAFGVSTPTGSVTVNLRMPGQYYDSESGLFYNWNRYYNQAIGRYISSDPIGLVGGLNTFGYVRQNPANRIDPKGLLTITGGVTIRIPQWMGKIFYDDFIGAGFSGGVAVQLTRNGEFLPDLGLFLTGNAAGEDFGIGRGTIDLGIQEEGICELAGTGGNVSVQAGTFGGGYNIDNNGDFQGIQFSLGAGYNVSGVGTIGASWGFRDGLTTDDIPPTTPSTAE